MRLELLPPVFLGWADGCLCWRCGALDQVDEVRVDGIAADRADWSVAADGTLQLRPDAILFDARPHAIVIVGSNGGEPARLTAQYRSVYRGALTEQANGRLQGWIVDDTCPQRAVRLVADLSAGASPQTRQVLAADPRPHPAAQDAIPQGRGAGFTIAWNPWRHGADIDLRIDGTGCHPFGHLRRLAPAAPHAVPAPDAPAPPLAGDILQPSYRRQGPPRVAVIVPVYGGCEDTLICLRSLRASQDRIASEVIVIDDASPERALSQAVAEFAAEAGFTHLRNPHNLGFVATVNRGLGLRPDHDVVLLNADTEVPDGWLDRLHQAVARDPRIATATPLSNNATIMSLPEIGGSPVLPFGLSLAEIDALCRDLNGDLVQDVPTGHGFCLYIRRDALNDVGDLDEALFGRGYGEENDFCLRARAQGWRNVAVAGLFVRHVGSVSFTATQGGAPGETQGETRTDLLARNLVRLNQRHPGYAAEISAYIEADPLRHARRRPQLSLWRRRGPPVIMMTLALPGGTARHVRGLTRQIAQTGRLVLWLHAENAEAGSAGSGAIALSDPLSEATLRYSGEDGAGEALADILTLEPEFIHVHHLLDLPSQIETFLSRSGIPYVVTVHDYFFGCPRITLIDDGGTFCGAPAARYCAPCLAAAPPHMALHPSLHALGRDNEAWRAKWAAFLAGARQILVPSQITAHYMGRMFPALEMTVRPHPAVAAPSGTGDTVIHGPSGQRDPTRVAVIGALGPHKGAAQLHDLARYCHRHEADLRFVVIGHTDRDDALARYPNVELAGAYEPDAALPAIAAAGCTTALFLSIWPETYCFTLSEALLAGLIPVAFDIGAIGERLRALGYGTLLAPHSPAAEIVAALREAGGASASATPLPPAAIDGQYDTLFGDYYTVLAPQDEPRDHVLPGIPPGATPAGASPGSAAPDAGPLPFVARVRPAPVTGPLIPMTEVVGLSGDLWCVRRFRLALYVRQPLADATLKLWTHPDHLSQNLQAWIEGGARHTIWLQSGRIGRVTLPVADRHRTVLRIFAQFDFATPLAPPDRREGGAKLVGICCTGIDGASANYGIVSTDDAEPESLELVEL